MHLLKLYKLSFSLLSDLHYHLSVNLECELFEGSRTLLFSFLGRSRSQEVELLVEGTHFLVEGVLQFLVLLTAASTQSFLRDTHGVEEVSDFVSVLARGRHFDRASPVEVEVAQSVGQLLNF